MSALTLASPIPESVIILSDDALNRLETVLTTSGVIAAIPDGNESEFKKANAAYVDLVAFLKEIESQRTEVKAPVLAFGKQIDVAAQNASAPLDKECERLGALVKDWQKKENARREEAARKAREEQERLVREAQEKAESERLERIRLANEERQRIIDAQQVTTPDDEDAPPIDEPAPVDAEVFTAPVAVYIPRQYVPPPIKSSVRETKNHTVIIDDLSLIPREIQGAQLFVLDEAVVKRLLKAGIKIPGCHLEESSGTAPTGRK